MKNKISFFFLLYDKEEGIYKFLFDFSDPDFYRHSNNDILINNSKYFFLQILEDKIVFCSEYDEYIL